MIVLLSLLAVQTGQVLVTTVGTVLVALVSEEGAEVFVGEAEIVVDEAAVEPLIEDVPSSGSVTKVEQTVVVIFPLGLVFVLGLEVFEEATLETVSETIVFESLLEVVVVLLYGSTVLLLELLVELPGATVALETALVVLAVPSSWLLGQTVTVVVIMGNLTRLNSRA